MQRYINKDGLLISESEMDSRDWECAYEKGDISLNRLFNEQDKNILSAAIGSGAIFILGVLILISIVIMLMLFNIS